MYESGRPIIGYFEDRQNKDNSAGLHEILCNILGENVIEAIDLKNNYCKVDFDSIIYWGPFRTIFDEDGVISAYKDSPGLVISLSEEEGKKWIGYLSNKPHYKVIWGVEEAYKDLDKEEIGTNKLFSEPIGVRLGMKFLRDGIIQTLERRSKQLGSLWFSPRYEIQKIIFDAFVTLIDQLTVKHKNYKIRLNEEGYNEYQLVRIKEGLVPGKPTDVRIIESWNTQTAILLYSMVVPVQVISKDAYTFLYSEAARNYRLITSYLQGILHGLLNSQIDEPIAGKLNIETKKRKGFVCKLSCLPPFNDNIYSHFIEPIEVLLDVTISPSISEFEAPYKDRDIKVSQAFYKNSGYIKEYSFIDTFLKRYDLKEFKFTVQHGNEFANIPVVICELALNIISKFVETKQVAILFGEDSGLWKTFESHDNIEVSQFDGNKIWQSIEYDAALHLFKKNGFVSKYDILIADPPRYRVVDFLLSNLKVKSEMHEQFPTGENMVQRIARGSRLFIVKGGNNAEKNTLNFITNILTSNFDICYQFALAGEVVFICGEVSQSKNIQEALDQTKKIFDSEYNQSKSNCRDFICIYKSLSRFSIRHHSKKGKIVIITGPSGAGKDTLATNLIEKYGNYFEKPYQFISRELRLEETIRKDVRQMNKEIFLESGNDLLSPSFFNENLYAYSKKNVKAILDSGLNCIINVDNKGIKDIFNFTRTEKYDLSTLCILADKNVCENHIKKRQPNISNEELQKRLATVGNYSSENQNFDYVIWNNRSEEDFINESIQWLKESELIPEDVEEMKDYRVSISYSSNSAFISLPRFSNEKIVLTNEIAEILRENNWASGSFLDIGAGSGEITTRIVERFKLANLMIVEPSRLNINILKEKIRNLQLIHDVPLRFQAIEQGWPEASREIDNQFNLITMMHVYPKGNLEDSLKPIHKILDRDGIFMLIVHDPNSQHIQVQQKIKKKIGGKVWQKTLQNPNPTSDTFIKAAEDNGFEKILEKTVTSHFKINFPSKIEDIFKSEYLVNSAAVKFFADIYLDELAACHLRSKYDNLLKVILKYLDKHCKSQAEGNNIYNIISSHKIVLFKKE